MIRVSRLGAYSRVVSVALGLLVISARVASATEQGEDPFATALTLEEVTRTADSFFPILQAARLEGEVREEKLRTVRGAFDTTLSLDGEITPLGFYENRTGSASIEQPTPLWGSRVYAGYRYGEGDFPSYQGGELTDSAGEVHVGLDVPLFRGGRIDQARASIAAAKLDRKSFTPEIELDRLRVIRDATLAYWDWVAAGRVVEITAALLEVAEARQTQIARRVERGGEAEINLADNQRLVVERRARHRGAERDFRQATLRLSLYYRDEEGSRIAVDASRLPASFPEEFLLDSAMVASDLGRVRKEHPRLRQLTIERERLALDVRVAQNDGLPKVNLGLEGSQDFGNSRPGIDERGSLSSDSRSSTEVSLRMRFELPFQRREARGRLGVARIRLDQLDRRIQFAAEQVETEALIALESLEAAFVQTSQARQNVELADRLRTAEARKLRAGLSNLIDLNIREIQAASASQDLVQAQRAYFRALAEYRARVAMNG